MRSERNYPPMITPHNDDFSIDREGFSNTIEHLMTSGAHGLIADGTTGEYYAQTAEERIDLLGFARQMLASQPVSVSRHPAL